MIDEQTAGDCQTHRCGHRALPSDFGSYGRDEAYEDSDLDIMVIQSRDTNRGEEMVRLRQLIGAVGAGVDVLVYSEAEYERRSRVAGTLLYWARKEGQTIYEAPH